MVTALAPIPEDQMVTATLNGATVEVLNSNGRSAQIRLPNGAIDRVAVRTLRGVGLVTR